MEMNIGMRILIMGLSKHEVSKVYVYIGIYG